MSKLGPEFKVGLFSIFAGSVIAYMFFVLSPDYFSNQEYQTYHSIVKDAAGIVTNTHVKTNGVVVGKVSRIELQKNQTRIEFSVKSSVKIPQGSTIEIKEKGLLGDVFLEVNRGPDSGSYIPGGGEIPPSNSQTSISALIGIAGSVGKDVKQITSSLADVLGGEKGKSSLSSIVADLKMLAQGTREMVEENRSDVREIVADFRATSNTLKKVINSKERDLTEIVTNVKSATNDLRAFSAAIKDVVNEQNRDRIEKILASFDTTMEDIELTAKNVRQVSNKIDRGEGTIGKLINDEKTVFELESALKEVRQVLAPATKMQLAVDYRGEVRKDETTQHYFNTIMKTRPDKFYLLGFTDHSETVIERSFEELEPRDVSSDSIATEASPRRHRERVIEKKAIRFNLQFGKRWHFAQLRFGLFESTGGIASDLWFFNDRVRLSFEAFNWSSTSRVRRTAHLKAYASMLFMNHIYTLVGVDDITRLNEETGIRNPDLNYFLGAGLNFNDDDLKTLLGTASLAL